MTRKLTSKARKVLRSIKDPGKPFLARCRDFGVTIFCAGAYTATKYGTAWTMADVGVLLAIVAGCYGLASSTPASQVSKAVQAQAGEQSEGKAEA